MPRRFSKACCSSLGSVTRRSRISWPSVVGSTLAALCKVESRASALMGDSGWAVEAPLTADLAAIAGRRFSRGFRVIQRA
jgi:hypothetical protein